MSDNIAAPFPITGHPSEYVLEDSELVATSGALATPATPEEIAKESTGWGYTNPNLHRRIQLLEYRDSSRHYSQDFYIFSSVDSIIAQGETLTLSFQLNIIVEVRSCYYDTQELTEDIDYSVLYDATSGILSLTLLSTSTIIPVQPDLNKKLRVNFRKYYKKDYSLEIQGVYSYRTTTRYLHDEDETIDVSQPEIP